MDTLVQIYSSSLNRYIYNPNSISTPMSRNHANEYNPDHSYTHFPIHSNEPTPPPPVNESPPASAESSEVEVSEKPDYFDAVLKYLTQMLMEEDDLQHKPCMFNECLALQAAEKSLYDVLVDNHPSSGPSLDQHLQLTIDQNGNYQRPSDYLKGTFSSEDSSSNHSIALHHTFSSDSQSISSSSIFNDVEQWLVSSNLQTHFPDGSRGKRSHNREDDDPAQEERSNKQLAGYANESDSDQLEMYDKALLSDDMNPYIPNEPNKKGSKAGRPRGKKKDDGKEVVDLRNLLTQCAQAMTNGNSSSAHYVLKKIQQHSSPYGDATERVAHYFANAIEARLAGTGVELYQAFGSRRISAAQTLKAYQTYITACPFLKMSNIFANRSIKEVSSGRKKLHIIDFGILYGFQWPCFIQGLSLRPGGPPELRITGIDLPQPGFHPEERIEETGHRLAKYCHRFKVPFKYNAIAKKWENVRIEDLKIERDEVIVVNSMHRLRNVPDETVVESSPRDAVLDLIKRIKPDMFVHGVLNGTFNAPFLLTRFREALYHFSTLFDMLDETTPREDENRLLYEQERFARDAMNVIACEGTSRVERPETYRQWQSRIVRAGFRQQPLYPDILKEVRAKVKLNYHKDFLVDEDGNWMLQGWKGRVLYALSLWKPVEE